MSEPGDRKRKYLALAFGDAIVDGLTEHDFNTEEGLIALGWAASRLIGALPPAKHATVIALWTETLRDTLRDMGAADRLH